MDHLTAAFDAFKMLPPEHPDEMSAFIHGIHECQFLLALRVCRREYPAGWTRRAVPGPGNPQGLALS